jgi:predicted kinase
MQSTQMTAIQLVRALIPRRGARRLVLLIGVPASGKTGIAAAFSQLGFVRLSFDQAREELYQSEGEQGVGSDVGSLFRTHLAEALQGDKSIVVDNTNFLIDMRKQVIDAAVEAGVTDIHLVVMKVPLADCLARNARRERQVPEEVIRSMHAQLRGREWPSNREGRITIVRPGANPGEFHVSGSAALRRRG